MSPSPIRIATRSNKCSVAYADVVTYMNLQTAGDGIGGVGTDNVDSPQKEKCDDRGEEHWHGI